MTEDQLRHVRKETGVCCKCPHCRSHMLPAEDHFRYTLTWTNKERALTKKFFHDPDLKGSAKRLERSGESRSFAKDLKVARK